MQIENKKRLGKTLVLGIVIITIPAFLGLTPKADALGIPSEKIVMIDGTGDNDSTVQIMAFELMNFNVDFGYMSGGTFNTLPAFYSFDGGDIINFAIRETIDGQTMVTAASSGAARMDFFGVVPAENSENPVVEFDYWKGVNIFWRGAWADELLVSVSSRNDGLAPAYGVPDANIMLFLGPALLGLGIIGRKKPRNKLFSNSVNNNQCIQWLRFLFE